MSSENINNENEIEPNENNQNDNLNSNQINQIEAEQNNQPNEINIDQDQEFHDANENENNEFEQYFVPENDDDDDDDELDFEDEDDYEDEDEDEMDEENEEDEDDYYDDTIEPANDEYEDVEAPSTITYNTELPSSHNYLGQNFQEVSSSKYVHDSNDEIQIPLLAFPGNSFHEVETDNNVQLIPGQVMPIYFYSPIQIQVIRKRMSEQNPIIGFALCPKYLRFSNESSTTSTNEDQDEIKLGILAEIISASQPNEDEITDFTSLIESAGGLILKVKGKERFRILNMRKDITGNVIATVKILPEYVLSVNPLIKQCPRNLVHIYDSYLHKNNSSKNNVKNLNSKAEYFNTQLNQPAWVYRTYDCDYLIYLIKKELTETFKQPINFEDSNDMVKNSIIFCSWLLTNFPFDNKMRINCLKMNCVNQRLLYMHSLLKKFTNINCRLCMIQFCTKSDVFSISKQGFMSAFLNPGGVVHETLTVYKLKNFNIMSSRPSTQHSWFPGYAWQIITCRQCNSHIGWKFTNAEPNLKPEKFFGLTRKAIRYTFDESSSEQINNSSQNNENQIETMSVQSAL